MQSEWYTRRPAPEGYIARLQGMPRPSAQLPEMPRAIAQVLYNRGIETPDAVAAFIRRDLDEHNPFHLRGMTPAVTRIRDAIARGERIVVHGDFDADGVTATAVMVEGLEALGADVREYIPHRVDEGYGINGDALHALHREGIELLVTVDCGIRAGEEIAIANELGIDVIVTDHHSPGELPDALAIVNPHRPDCPYPHKMLSGVGIAWKVIQALALAERKSPIGSGHAAVDLEGLLELVAIGAVADIVPLTGENRNLVARGLARLRESRRPGVRALFGTSGIEPGDLRAEGIAFYLGPRINAAGRLDSALLAYELLRATDSDEAARLADALEKANRRRQRLTEEAFKRAEAQLTDPTAPLLMVADDACHEGIVGLVAGRLAERNYRPTIVLSRGETVSRASCRSIPEFHITRALEEVAPLLERYGGHAAAAGFTVRSERIGELHDALTEIAWRELGGADGVTRLRPRLLADMELPLGEINHSLLDWYEPLAPFGEQNEEPLWMARDVRVYSSRTVGRDQQHLKLELVDERHRRHGAIGFRMGNRLASLPGRIDIAYRLKRTVWRDRPRIEIHLEDLRPARETVPTVGAG